jgi:hypothetical protein
VPARPPAFGIRGHVDVGYLSFSASESMDAVYGKTGGAAWGGGVRVTHRRGLFGQLSAARFSATGERVFVANDEVFPLGIPTELTVTPIDITGGWRFVRSARPGAPRPPGRPAQPPAKPPEPAGTPAPPAGKPPQPPARPAAAAAPRGAPRLVPYVGGGIGIVRLTERADFAASGDDVESSHTSYHVLGGADIAVTRLFGAGIEAGWRWVPDALAGTGVADAFDEPDLDHFFLMVRFTIGR